MVKGELMNEQNLNYVESKLDELNDLSEEIIRESYLAGSCRTIWILGLDDGMN
jgi:hypothetical protein